MCRIPTRTEQSSVVTILVYHFLIEGYPRWQTGLVKQDFLNSDIFLVCTLQERQIIRNLIGKAEPFIQESDRRENCGNSIETEMLCI